MNPHSHRPHHPIDFFTGDDHSGKTTLAYGAALQAAMRYQRVALIHIDPPTPIAVSTPSSPHLYHIEVHSLTTTQNIWQEYLHTHNPPLVSQHQDTHELIPLPGIEKISLLLTLYQYTTMKSWDHIIIDGPSTSRTLELLTYARYWNSTLEQLWPTHRRLNMLHDPHMGPIAGFLDYLSHQVQQLTTWLFGQYQPHLYLVSQPHHNLIARAQQLLGNSALLGIPIYEIIFNGLHHHNDNHRNTHQNDRLYPHPIQHQIRQAITLHQDLREQLHQKLSSQQYAIIPYSPDDLTQPHHIHHLWNQAQRTNLGHQLSPITPLINAQPSSKTRREYQLSLQLPYLNPARFSLGTTGSELIVNAYQQRHIIPLTPVLQRCQISQATLKDDMLCVYFHLEPDKWPCEENTHHNYPNP